MPTTQKQASVARNILFRSTGLNFSTFLHASTGDLIQQYDDEGNFYPEISNTDPIRVQFTATSSKSQGAITPDSITYKIGGVELAFNSSGVCTTTGASSYFKRDGADLVIIGNIADYLGYSSSLLEAFAECGADKLYACCPVDISKRAGGRRQKVSIAPGDNKNFTLTSQTDSVKLKAGVLLKSGWDYNSPKRIYVWEIADPTATSGWRCIQWGNGTYGTLTLHASQVNTYANIRCTVLDNPMGTGSTAQDPTTFNWATVLKTLIIGSDCVGVLDASDPLDIICEVKINKTGTGSEVAADEEALNDSMPATAYLIYTPTLVVRGQTTSAGTTTWLTGLLVDPAGVTVRNVPPSSGKYKVMVSDMSAYGQYTLIMTGELA